MRKNSLYGASNGKKTEDVTITMILATGFLAYIGYQLLQLSSKVAESQ